MLENLALIPPCTSIAINCFDWIFMASSQFVLLYWHLHLLLYNMLSLRQSS
jgi:hypothetical protein